MRVDQRRNEGPGETADPRENLPTSGNVRHDSHMRKSGVTRPGIEPGVTLQVTQCLPWRGFGCFTANGIPKATSVTANRSAFGIELINYSLPSGTCHGESPSAADFCLPEAIVHECNLHRSFLASRIKFEYVSQLPVVGELADMDLMYGAAGCIGLRARHIFQLWYENNETVHHGTFMAVGQRISETVSEEIWAAHSSEVFRAERVIEVRMEQRQNERAGKMGNLRENPPTSGIVQHDSHMRKSGSDPAAD
ncbi:hypothetical protein PR048_002863 [Dryococelus australis]|uniref:Uncharacterized protein n=1 Tax=Dryococelus australis TaxID=614101 RepID=A0ABQ9IMF9_9NEOP|nr:hypothetical protein PR048_002863 [Dryococelus australis]